MKKLILLLALIFIGHTATIADDGSRLWLPTPGQEASQLELSIKGFDRSNPTIAIAAKELHSSQYASPVIFKKAKGMEPEAYAINRDAKGRTVIAASSPIGILYGTYQLMRCNATGAPADNIAEVPAYKVRALNHWDNLDGTVERGYAGFSLWKWDELPGTVSPRYEQYARACASVGINASVLNNVNAAPEMLLTENLEKVAKIADVLRPYGVKTYLSVNFASPQEIGGLPTADPLDPAVAKWWADKAKEIYTLIPDFGGFLVKANSEGKPGPCDFGRTHADGANMLADALAPHGGIVMWRSFVYNPASDDRAMQAFLEFEPFDGQFRDNVIIQIKNGPVDFQPREPYSPLFGAMPHTQQMVEFQITQEYLGASNHMFYQAPLWKECLDADTGRPQLDPSTATTIAGITAAPLHGLSAIAGVANIGDDPNWCGHLFAQSNWYAFGRLAWDPTLSSQQIAEEWLKQTFTTDPDFVQPVSAMMLDNRETVTNYMMPIGLHHIFAEGHHYGPEPWYTQPGMRADWSPLYYHRASSDGIGFDRTQATGSGATGQYAGVWKEKFENIDLCPDEYLLWFHRVGWDHTMKSGRTLWDELCHRYDTGLKSAREYQITWDAMEPYVDPELFAHVQSKLKIQTHDAQWWKDACLLYFQQFSGLPFPADMERPVYELPYLMNFHIPLGLHGCPTRQQLP